ncbi:hypothetical protein ABH931_006150 [Streptacidiphilus sp. MAP12-33]|uniref:hypothetical protein n=1 Tax=Streptacidiphilus sp. MAP12-33 TaxID=3156266 RepID=UPI003519017F
MSLWTCIACTARRAVGLLTCPQCGAAGHEEGDTLSGSEGGQGQRHIPEAYADQAPTPVVADAASPATPAPAEVQATVAADEPPPAADTATP